jgi:hypothetical protein
MTHIFSRKNFLILNKCIYVVKINNKRKLNVYLKDYFQGSPECLKSQPPCARPSILFKLLVVVTGQEKVPETSGFEALMAILALLAVILIIRR